MDRLTDVQQKTLNVLIVDDSNTQLAALKNILLGASLPLEVWPALSLREAMDTLRTNGGADLIMLDIVMPGIDGIKGCRMIKAHAEYTDIPVIMVTKKDDEQSLNSAFEAGAMDYITKPPSALEVRARVRSALRLKQEMDRRKARECALESALAKVKKLSGLLPICAHCKRIRNDAGYWQQIEEYIHQHSEADFSHGICPECMQAYYPELRKDGS